MIYYMIRHKTTGEFMPQMKRNRGYTHWNPGSPNPKKVKAALDVPRLLYTKGTAARVIAMWASMPNAYNSFRVGYYGEEDDGIDIKDDGRKREDLEIVEVDIVEVKE